MSKIELPGSFTMTSMPGDRAQLIRL
jgi:hypothetical protein